MKCTLTVNEILMRWGIIKWDTCTYSIVKHAWGSELLRRWNSKWDSGKVNIEIFLTLHCMWYLNHLKWDS